MAKKPKLALIDSHALIHRAYHALPPMSTRDGTPTNAVYGFTTTLLKVLQSLKPTHVVAAFDMKGPTFRHEAFADYKAHRKEADEELIVQFDLVREVLEAFNIPRLGKKGFEADDVIGTLTRGLSEGVAKVIVTGDMDTLQLVDDHTSVFTLKRGIGDTILYDEEMVQEKYGFAPEHLVDYKGLRGDPSDNIPGVAGIGDKTARELVAQYGTIERIYDHLEELPKRARTRLEGHLKEALMSRELATIRCDVPLEFELPEAQLSDYDVEQVRQVFEKFEFRSLLERLPKSSRGALQPTLFQNSESRIENREVKREMPENYHLVESKKDQQALQKKLLKAKVIAFDTETDRLGARQYPIIGMSFAHRTKQRIEAYYVPVTPKTVEAWRELLENPTVLKVGHNLKYDIAVLRQSGIELGGVFFDTMLASYLLHPGARQHGLDALAVQELGHHPIPITDLIGKGKEQKTMSEVPLQDVAVYAAEDADVSFRLYEALAPKLKDEGLVRVFEELEVPLVPVLAAMELAGVKLNTDVLAAIEKKVTKRIAQLTDQIYLAAGEQFNINSTQQLRAVLYEKLKLPTVGIGRTQTGFSTAAAELVKLRDTHEIIVLIEEYRELTKLLNTYITVLPELVDPITGRVHTSFNQTVAATGRLSSQDPNLQNIPVRTELGQEIRAAFVAERGAVLVKADYSQLELRIAAHISQDEKMLDAFRAGEDIHRSTAAWVHGVKPDEVTDVQRRNAKTLNFGVLYGMGPMNFARAAGISIEEARSFVERYKREYKGVATYIEETIAQAEELGYTETLLGRRRYVPEIESRSPGVRAAAERAAFNHPIQGTEADIVKKAMIELYAYLQKHYPKANLVLTVHDELVVEAPSKQAEQIARDMKKIMEGVTTLDVPLTVDVAIGKNWRDTAPLRGDT